MLRFVLAFLAALGMASIVGVGTCFIALLWNSELLLILSLVMGIVGGIVSFCLILSATSPHKNPPASHQTKISKLNQRDTEQ